MIKVEVIEEFTLGRFDELKNIQRKSREEKGRLFVGDIFECDKELADYLLGANALKRAFVKVIRIIPEEDEFENAKKVVIELKEEKEAPKKVATKTTTKKETKSKKTIAKK